MAEESPENPCICAQVDTLLQNASLPKIYTNSFIVGLNAADLSIIVQQNGLAVAAVQMAHTLAKTLAVRLMESLEDFEDKTATTVERIDTLNTRLREAAE